MTTKVAEIRQDHRGDRRACPICSPRSDRVPADRLWAWSLDNPGKHPLLIHREEAS